MAVETFEEIYNFEPRGIGSNFLRCFICNNNEERRCQPDMAAFVKTKEDGGRIVALFTKAKLKATLDFRPQEPNWVQVKLGSCQEHLPILEKLYKITCKSNSISKSILDEILREV